MGEGRVLEREGGREGIAWRVLLQQIHNFTKKVTNRKITSIGQPLRIYRLHKPSRL